MTKKHRPQTDDKSGQSANMVPDGAPADSPAAGYRLLQTEAELRRPPLAGKSPAEPDACMPEQEHYVRVKTTQLPTFSQIARRLLVERVPRLARANLNIVTEEFSLHPMLLAFCTHATGLIGTLLPEKVLAARTALIKKHNLMRGWRCRMLGSACLDHDISVRKPSGRLLNINQSILEERTGFNECVLEFVPDGDRTPVYLVCAQQQLGPDRGDVSQWHIIFERGQAASYHALVGECRRFTQIQRRQRKKRNTVVQVANVEILEPGFRIELDTSFEWADIIMSDNLRRSVYDDFMFFTRNETWFQRNRLPFKRGYLLMGPPGNGKTMIARALASTPGFSAFSFDFSAKGCNSNQHLFHAFDKAENQAPSVFIMEDIDRIFEHGDQTDVTKDGLLNCLDGIGSRKGIVVVATANHPELIDPALLHRPGRFDRVIRIDNPDNGLRHQLLRHLFHRAADAQITKEALAMAAEITSGFSMADIKEVFVSAGSLCSSEHDKIIQNRHLHQALQLVRDQFKSSTQAVGFTR